MSETAIGGHFNGFGTGSYTGDNGVSWSFGGEKELMLLLYIVFQVLQWPLIIPVKDMLEQMLASMDCCIYSWSIKCSKDKALFIKNTSVVNDFFFGVKSGVKSYDINGQLMKTASVVENRTVHVAALPKGICSRDCKW